jgi:hypothetical protein
MAQLEMYLVYRFEDVNFHIFAVCSSKRFS